MIQGLTPREKSLISRALHDTYYNSGAPAMPNPFALIDSGMPNDMFENTMRGMMMAAIDNLVASASSLGTPVIGPGYEDSPLLIDMSEADEDDSISGTSVNEGPSSIPPDNIIGDVDEGYDTTGLERLRGDTPAYRMSAAPELVLLSFIRSLTSDPDARRSLIHSIAHRDDAPGMTGFPFAALAGLGSLISGTDIGKKVIAKGKQLVEKVKNSKVISKLGPKVRKLIRKDVEDSALGAGVAKIAKALDKSHTSPVIGVPTVSESSQLPISGPPIIATDAPVMNLPYDTGSSTLVDKIAAATPGTPSGIDSRTASDIRSRLIAQLGMDGYKKALASWAVFASSSPSMTGGFPALIAGRKAIIAGARKIASTVASWGRKGMAKAGKAISTPVGQVGTYMAADHGINYAISRMAADDPEMVAEDLASLDDPRVVQAVSTAVSAQSPDEGFPGLSGLSVSRSGLVLPNAADSLSPYESQGQSILTAWRDSFLGIPPEYYTGDVAEVTGDMTDVVTHLTNHGIPIRSVQIVPSDVLDQFKEELEAGGDVMSPLLAEAVLSGLEKAASSDGSGLSLASGEPLDNSTLTGAPRIQPKLSGWHNRKTPIGAVVPKPPTRGAAFRASLKSIPAKVKSSLARFSNAKPIKWITTPKGKRILLFSAATAAGATAYYYMGDDGELVNAPIDVLTPKDTGLFPGQADRRTGGGQQSLIVPFFTGDMMVGSVQEDHLGELPVTTIMTPHGKISLIGYRYETVALPDSSAVAKDGFSPQTNEVTSTEQPDDRDNDE